MNEKIRKLVDELVDLLGIDRRKAFELAMTLIEEEER